jgi:hypothetical protein
MVRVHFRPVVALLVCVSLLAPLPPGTGLVPPANASAIELKKETLAAFERYVRVREAQIDEELRRENPFLWIDSLPEERRRDAYEHLKRGEVFIERRKILDGGKEIECPDGLIHHWMGTVFIPGATLERAIALVQDYDDHATNYAPEVLISKTLERNGNDFKIHMRFLKKKVITVVVDTWQDVQYVPLSATRMYSRALTTRIQEVEHASKPEEHLKPPGKDGGFLWNLYTYWRFEERDGGVYIQCEAISLTRSVPFLLAWLKPFITGVPKESLMFTLGTTRARLMK